VAFASQAAQGRSARGMCWRSRCWVGCPGGIGDDNLRAAVDRILQGRDRVENQRFIALRSHYGFDSFLLPARQAWRA